MLEDIQGKVAWVTGAGTGIGESGAIKLAEAGCKVVLSGRRQDVLENVASKISGEVSIQPLDVSDNDAVVSVAEAILNEHGQIDIGVFSAGINVRERNWPVVSIDDWNKVININLNGAFNGIKAVSQIMIKQRAGRIINISSIVGLIGNPGQANYAASKAGLIGLSKSAAKELAPRGITVNAIAPGYIATDMTDQITDQAKESLITKIPLGRIGSPSDIATSALFLASDEAGYITGQTLTVDGGMVMI